MRPSAPLHPAPLALFAGLAIAACGHGKVAPSDKPATVERTPSSGSAGATATPTRSPRKLTGTFTGSDILTRFGDVQVSVTLERGRITDVKGVKLPFDRPRSQYISQAASPLLRNEVLNAQSANINLISGATYTSEAWANSVQAALTQAH